MSEGARSTRALESVRALASVPRRTSAALLAAFALVGSPDCVVESDRDRASGSSVGGFGGAGGATDVEGVPIAAALWTLAWDETGVDRTPAGIAIENDRGYRIELTLGRILSHSVSLAPCAVPSGAGGGGGLGRTERPSRLHPFSVRSAYAHTEGADPSQVEAALVEDLLDPIDVTLDASFSPADYCGVHWLLARPLAATRGASDVDMSERSVLLEGTILRDGEVRPLHVDTWWPHGALASLDELVPAEKLAEVRARGGAHYALVRVTRKLASMFDGIDFFVDGDDRVAGTIVDRLAEDARFEVELWSPSVGP